MIDRTLKGAAFPPYHKYDRAMVAGVAVAVWLAIVAGFAIDLVNRTRNHALDFPLIVHLHAVVYSAWLVLLAAQVCLMRTKRADLHRRLGAVAMVLLPLMLVLGPAAAIAVANPYTPDRWVSWMSVQFTNAFGSVVLLAAGLLIRRDGPSHKRLMLMGSVAVTEPGFSRIWEPILYGWWGDGYVSFYFSTYIGTFLLILAVGAYDVATRRRLHPAFVGAALWIFANEAFATWLYYQPFWLHAMRAITKHGM
jgi:uncharacterized membrane protein YozB (DUF420 family)